MHKPEQASSLSEEEVEEEEEAENKKKEEEEGKTSCLHFSATAEIIVLAGALKPSSTKFFEHEKLYVAFCSLPAFPQHNLRSKFFVFRARNTQIRK